ncbi:endocuticle structural glycoprotein SgAbd-2-like isoform X2 [Diprion similis]|uniref:endocuticle structural glycoprotein SgAbd-2-like isoform X2 n=1 Tax=Diprion similis TaxID=362088 RepID=UPI001EF7F25A|nr:endocuticle structural glycoprotein SgAbd-2-like isoform X2 [Diprion similis]
MTIKVLSKSVVKYKALFSRTVNMNSALFFVMLFGAACAAGLDKDASIDSQVLETDFGGAFKNSWSGNNILVDESGSVKPGPENTVVQTIEGQVSYTAPDGTPIQTRYIADENGFRAEGAHLPVAPELPPYIARALAWAKDHPYNEEAELRKTYN